MPLAFSISIQSETVERRPDLPWTAPASVITWACRASASVSVDLPASGWLITAKVRRRARLAAYVALLGRAEVRLSVGVEVTRSCIVGGLPGDGTGPTPESTSGLADRALVFAPSTPTGHSWLSLARRPGTRVRS